MCEQCSGDIDRSFTRRAALAGRSGGRDRGLNGLTLRSVIHPGQVLTLR